MGTETPGNTYNDKSWKELLVEILRLILKLLWKITKRLIKLIIKGVKWMVKTIKETIAKVVEWWNANDTQVKVRIIRLKARSLARKLIKWTIAAAKTTAEYTVKGCKLLVKSIIDLKPTIVKIGNAIAKAFDICWKWTKKQYYKAKISNARRKIQYKKFRKHPGFKGLFIDIGVLLKSQINSYMEEEQTEFTKDVTENEEEGCDNSNPRTNSTAYNLSKRIMTSVKDFVET